MKVSGGSAPMTLKLHKLQGITLLPADLNMLFRGYLTGERAVEAMDRILSFILAYPALAQCFREILEEHFPPQAHRVDPGNVRLVTLPGTVVESIVSFMVGSSAEYPALISPGACTSFDDSSQTFSVAPSSPPSPLYPEVLFPVLSPETEAIEEYYKEVGCAHSAMEAEMEAEEMLYIRQLQYYQQCYEEEDDCYFEVID